MTRGFKKKIGNKIKFVPTNGQSKSSVSSKDIRKKQSIKFNEPMKPSDELKKKKAQDIPKQKVTDVVMFDDLDESGKEKARDWWREGAGQDTFYSDFDGYFYDKKTKLSEFDVFTNTRPKYWNVGYGHEYIQFDFGIKDEKKLATLLGIPEELRLKVDFSFSNENENNTRLVIHDGETGETIEFNDDPTYEDYKKYADEDDDLLSKSEWNKLENASEKFDSLMDDSVDALSKSYDYEQSDEHIDEMLRINEYEFDEEGNRI